MTTRLRAAALAGLSATAPGGGVRAPVLVAVDSPGDQQRMKTVRASARVHRVGEKAYVEVLAPQTHHHPNCTIEAKTLSHDLKEQ